MKAIARLSLLALCAVLGNRAAAQTIEPLPSDFRDAYAVICPHAIDSGGAWMRDPEHLSALGFTLKSSTDHILMAETRDIRAVYKVQERNCSVSAAYDDAVFVRGWRQLAEVLYPEADLRKMLTKDWHPIPILAPIEGRSFITHLGVTRIGGRGSPYLLMTPVKD